MELQDAEFRRAAGDGDDLNKKSFMALVMKMLKEKKMKKAPSSSDVERAFTIADENGNGKVSTLKILPRMITPDHVHYLLPIKDRSRRIPQSVVHDRERASEGTCTP